MKKTLYWILSLTWGCIMSIIGLIVTTFAIAFLKGKVHKNGWSYIVELEHEGNWGISLGCVSMCAKDCLGTRKHEFGHSIQNIIFGPLHIFLVCIPSVIWYWNNVKHPEIEYDSIWFEKIATEWGTKIVDSIEKE